MNKSKTLVTRKRKRSEANLIAYENHEENMRSTADDSSYEDDSDPSSSSDDSSSKDENSNNQNTQKITYQSFFRYEKDQNSKIGVCLLCEKKNLRKTFKMANGSTNGIKKHLEKEHAESYVILFPNSGKNKQHLIRNNQRLIGNYLLVS